MKKILFFVIFSISIISSFSACSPYYYDNAYFRPYPMTRYYSTLRPYYSQPRVRIYEHHREREEHHRGRSYRRY